MPARRGARRRNTDARGKRLTFQTCKRPALAREAGLDRFSRGSRARTRDLWFWRPPLYQLSYTPPSVYGVSRSSYPDGSNRDTQYGIRATLFRFPVIGMLAAPRTELAELQAIRIILLVLGGRVV